MPKVSNYRDTYYTDDEISTEVEPKPKKKKGKQDKGFDETHPFNAASRVKQVKSVMKSRRDILRELDNN